MFLRPGMAGILQSVPIRKLHTKTSYNLQARAPGWAQGFRERRKPVIKMIVVSICISLGGAAGWWLGAGFGLMTGYFLSLFGASAGLYLGRQFGRNYLD
jgi:hypothetical protein